MAWISDAKKMSCVSGLSEMLQNRFPTKTYPVHNQRGSYLEDEVCGKYTKIDLMVIDDTVHFPTGNKNWIIFAIS